ncbi:glycoside hydrolase family 97 protein [Flavobacterium restrictum]|uniref:Glycoside hydrolase family 97 protein n=1 Tax=Flavobacterium restrictum TaxID=2594428 RepID=A0A553E2Y6_9FLAO|nr:glycoside hydrolase family 97 protein [Flavobacterium restrictum]TRX39406.1 glycoside hydrolase family 97 protein [Flavobacterium restrictum]
MKKLCNLFLLVVSLHLFAGKPTNYSFVNADKTIKVAFYLNAKKSPNYKVFYNDKLVVNASELGIIREDGNFYTNLKIVAVSKAKPITDNYAMLQGKRKNIGYQANQYTVSLKNSQGKAMNIIFQISNDGIGFRYHFPETSPEIKKIILEKTSYNFDASAKAWLQPMSKAKTGWKETNPSYEEHYAMGVPVNTKPAIGEGWVYPALFHTNDTWLLVSEVGLPRNYCGSRLVYNDVSKAMQVTFPQKEEVFPNGALNPESTLPWFTPWRIITVGSLKTITESTLGTDLATPAIPMDTSFIKSGLSSWSWVLLKDESVNYETTHKFIDYAANMNWPYCLVDADWDTRIGYDKMKDLAAYAKGKNVKLLVWYNSSGSWNSTEYHPKSKLITHADRDREFSKLTEMGIAGVKVDFFGGDGQSMIGYYHDMLVDAATHKLMVNFHGATLPRGWQRTYPNLVSTEAVKGYEYITFFQDIADLAPSHCAMLPFARNVFDPMDFTPMVLDSIPNITRKTTPAFELALPVLFLSGVQHIAEIPEGMAKMPQYVVDYLKDIPTNWDDSKFIDGYPGKYIIMARKKDNVWHIVGINGENTPKEIEIDLSFVTNSKGFLISENEKGWQQLTVSKNTKLKVTLKPHDGFVVKI